MTNRAHWVSIEAYAELSNTCDALRAEVERLRTDERDLFARYEMALQTGRAAESRLAAATELIECWLARWPHDAILTARSRAFLAAQPAAPEDK